jgi:hypothetical protein
MVDIEKNIINKWLKLYFYNYNPSYFLQQIDENFCKNISLYFKSSNEFIQINLVQKNGLIIQHIINKGIIPSEKVQLAAVNQNRGAIYHIENPSEKVQLAAVNQNGSAIYYIENPSEKVQLAAVKQNIITICLISNPYPSVIELYEKVSGLKYEKQ